MEALRAGECNYRYRPDISGYQSDSSRPSVRYLCGNRKLAGVTNGASGFARCTAFAAQCSHS